MRDTLNVIIRIAKRNSLPNAFWKYINPFHTGVTPYNCDHKNCGKKFAQKSNIIRHKRCVNLKGS